jgi:hypothetical protein
MPTVVSKPRPRQRRPSAMASLTAPPLESSTTVVPASWRPRANSSKSLGLSWVTMPTALIQPRQLGPHATQLKCIGSFRSSSVTPACAEPPSITTRPGIAMQRAAALSIRPRVAAQRARAKARSEMRAHSEDSALEIVAMLIGTEMANKNTRITSMIP